MADDAVLHPEKLNVVMAVQLLWAFRKNGRARQVDLRGVGKDISVAELQICHNVKLA